MLVRIKNYWRNLSGENKHTMIWQAVLIATLIGMTFIANILAIK